MTQILDILSQTNIFLHSLALSTANFKPIYEGMIFLEHCLCQDWLTQILDILGQSTHFFCISLPNYIDSTQLKRNDPPWTRLSLFILDIQDKILRSRPNSNFFWRHRSWSTRSAREALQLLGWLVIVRA